MDPEHELVACSRSLGWPDRTRGLHVGAAAGRRELWIVAGVDLGLLRLDKGIAYAIQVMGAT